MDRNEGNRDVFTDDFTTIQRPTPRRTTARGGPFRLDESVAVLTRTPAVLDALLRGLPEGWTNAHEGGETWSPFDVDRPPDSLRARRLDSAGQNHPGARRVADVRSVRSLRAVRGVEGQDARRHARRVRGAARGEPAHAGGDEPDRRRPRSPRPASGVRRGDAGQLLATWTAHDLGHIAQIVRAMAKQYTEAVGPWEQYLCRSSAAKPSSVRSLRPQASAARPPSGGPSHRSPPHFYILNIHPARALRGFMRDNGNSHRKYLIRETDDG